MIIKRLEKGEFVKVYLTSGHKFSGKFVGVEVPEDATSWSEDQEVVVLDTNSGEGGAFAMRGITRIKRSAIIATEI